MAVQIIRDCPDCDIRRRVREFCAAAIGAVLAVVGTVAPLLIIPTSLLTFAWLRGENIDLGDGDRRDVTSILLTVWGVSTACLILRIPTGTKWFFFGSHALMRVVAAPFRIFRFYPVALLLATAIVGADVLRAVYWPARGVTVERVVTRYFELFEVLILSKRLPFDLVHADLPGAFAVILIVMGWALVVLPPIELAAQL